MTRKALRPRPLLLLLAAAAYSGTLLAAGFIRDDHYIVAGNALLRHRSSLPRLLSAGYWEGAVGAGAPVAEYRPVLMLTYFLTYQLAGLAPWAYHLGNLLLHAANCLLLHALLKRRMGSRTAFAAAALFAVLPAHSEAVAYVSGRSELLLAAFLLLAWLEAGRTRGVEWYCLALLSKEAAVLFPAVLAMDDWASSGRRFWEKGRRRFYAGLAAATAAYLLLRFALLDRPFHGGVDYFGGKPYLVRLLTVARFAAVHYLLPAATGLGLRADYSRPLIPDASAAEPSAWLSLAFWAAALAFSLLALARRRALSVWILGAFLFLLPTSNLVVPLDTLGAERFLYLPSAALCVGLALGLERLPSRPRLAALGLLLLWYGGRTVLRNRVWSDERSYYEAAVLENPVSAGAKSGLGVVLAREGRAARALELFDEAAALKPGHPAPYYNIGKLRLERGELREAQESFRKALENDPKDPDAWVFLAAVAERRGKPAEAAAGYLRALELRPWDPAAHFNLGRLHLAAGRPGEAAGRFSEYLRLAPDAQDADAIRALLRSLPPPQR